MTTAPGDTSNAGLAIDHALGLTEGAVFERAERLIATDTAFADDVASWRASLADIDATAPVHAPSPGLWSRIEGRLDEGRPADRPAGADVLEFGAPRTKPNDAARGRAASGVWRPLALAASLAALVFAGAYVREIVRGPIQPTLVAVLETPEGRPAAVVQAYGDGTVTLVPIERISVPEGRILEVWTLQNRERGPVSIGRLDAARTLKLDLKDLARPNIGHLFEITVEPTGGSPTGRPTGPILMKGLAASSL